MLLLVLLIAIIVLTVYFRIPMLKFYGFYEPDGFYHYSVMREAVAHGLAIQPYLNISGWPAPTKVTEPYGLYWVTLVPYSVLQYFGVTLYTSERLIPLLYGILDVLGAYLLSRYISKDKLFGILVMLFVALSGGDQARTSALIYRGDGFAAIFLILALVALLEVLRSTTRRRKVTFALLSGVALSFCNLVFSGGAFALGVYVLAFFIILAFAFVFAKRDVIGSLKYILLSAIVWFAITGLCLGLGWIQGQTFVGAQFFYLFIPMVAGWALSYLLLEKADAISRYVNVKPLLDTSFRRAVLLIVVMAVFAVVMVIAASGLIYAVFVANGFITSTNSNSAASSGAIFESTIQELQPPTPSFLFASFEVALYTTPPTLLVLLSSYIGQYTLVFILIIFSFLPYLFMQVYDSGGMLSGRPRLMFGVNNGMLVLISYFLVTAYLQIHAIRFNSLISVPLAILSAYTIYWLISYARQEGRNIVSAVALFIPVIVVAASVWMQLTAILPSELSSQSLAALAAAFLALLAGALILLKRWARAPGSSLAISIALIVFTLIYVVAQVDAFAVYPAIEVASIGLVLSVVALVAVERHIGAAVWYVFALLILAYVLIFYNSVYTAGLSQADSLNPSFFAALQWFKANSPANASVLTLWPDGSVVEGIANRSSITDSVGSQNYSRADPFGAWLLNDSDDPAFLTGNYSDSPGYLITRMPWLSETGGIYTEATISDPSLVASNFSYIRFSTFSEQANSSVVELTFTSQPQQDEELLAEVYIINNATSPGLEATLTVLNSSTGREIGTLPLHAVTFYNESNGAFSMANVSNVSAGDGYDLLLNYSGVPRPQTTINVTGAMIASPGLAESNLFKFLYLCNQAECVWDNGAASLDLVYMNNDTKIFKIVYNSSA